MEGFKNHRLNLAAELGRSMVNGPGVRYVLWVQGCPLKCMGCFNEDFQPFITRNVVDVDELAERILSIKDIEGVTYSGGEPMMQAEALYWLSRMLKRHGLTILCYTGFALEELNRQSDPYIEKLVNLLDILVDGPYEQDKKANLVWRGSTNQKVHFLTNKYDSYKETIEANLTEIEIVVDKQEMVLTGILREEIITRALRLLVSGERRGTEETMGSQ